MATKIYANRAEVEAEVKKLNSERKRTNIEYVVGTNYDWSNGGAVTGYYVGCCSDD